jgi:hypothetical protein
VRIFNNVVNHRYNVKMGAEQRMTSTGNWWAPRPGVDCEGIFDKAARVGGTVLFERFWRRRWNRAV